MGPSEGVGDSGRVVPVAMIQADDQRGFGRIGAGAQRGEQARQRVRPAMADRDDGRTKGRAHALNSHTNHAPEDPEADKAWV